MAGCPHVLSVVGHRLRSNLRACSHPAAKLQMRKERKLFQKQKQIVAFIFATTQLSCFDFRAAPRLWDKRHYI